MSVKTKQKQIFEQGARPATRYDSVTIGIVVDTNDPQQMGRVRVICPAFNELGSTPVDEVPWAIYASPFAGQMDAGTRGPSLDQSKGGVSYGFWAIPQIGAQVIVMCIDGDPNHRVYMGGIFDQLTPHTMPHGRWMFDDHPALQKETSNDSRPFGPYTSTEKFIEPLNSNMRTAFTLQEEPNFEWRTRAADYTVSALDVSALDVTQSHVQDDKDFVWDEWNSRQGYQVNRVDPLAKPTFTDRNYDNMVYAFVSPGFHAISMDDRQENCRMRFRTTAGNQILLDDTNERIYISTAKGNNWIEIDQAGNIDIYTAGNFSVKAAGDINFTSDKSIRMFADGIHLYSTTEVAIESATDVDVKAGQALSFESPQEINFKAGANLNLTSAGNVNILADGNVIMTGGAIQLNGPSALPATGAHGAMWTDRVPAHEPWARTMTLNDFTHEPEFPYTDPQVDREERGLVIERGRFWRR